MVKVYDSGAWLLEGNDIVLDSLELSARYGGSQWVPTKDEAAKSTMAYRILEAHNTSGSMEKLKIKFDALTSHDITYVGIVQTARASGLEKFPLPYVLTNCHNSLCAVGGTINEDDHRFGLSAAKKYGGVYVPAHQAVIHQYMREMMAGVGKMILGSDSHTRYGALGTLAIGEGGPELVKQLLGRTYDVDRPGVVAVHLTGKPQNGVGPQDVALAIIGATFKNGYVKNKVMEFVGEGVANLSAEYRIGIDVMTTETACLSSVWSTDGVIQDYLAMHGHPGDYAEMRPGKVAWYDGLITVDLSKVQPMIALPFHPSNVYTIEELNRNTMDILAKVEEDGVKAIDNPDIKFTLRDKVKNGRLYVQQGVIAGCAGGTYENIVEAANILDYTNIGDGEFSLSVYPSSQPVNLALTKHGVMSRLMMAGATIRTAFCGPCFGAGDVPANGGLSVRHTTRNFPSREGSKPQSGQIASVALMDARSVAATAANGGVLTAATGIEKDGSHPKYFFEADVYQNRCYDGRGKAEPDAELVYGPGITDWPAMQPLAEDLLLKVVSLITDPVTTTDELIPSGETSSYRSNPLALAEFALSRKDPGYVPAAKAVQVLEKARLAGDDPKPLDDGIKAAYDAIAAKFPDRAETKIGLGSVIYAKKPGDGSAREQAASCQKVLGTFANIAEEYATKRYRSNLINWGMLPFLTEGIPFGKGNWLYIPGIRTAVEEKRESIPAYVMGDGAAKEFTLTLAGLTDDERQIILDGCLINYYKSGK